MLLLGAVLLPSAQGVSQDFTIGTVAGAGRPVNLGNGGPAVQAQLNSPDAVTVDSAGNLYIANTDDHRILKVDSTGTITTVAGSGEGGFSGDGGPATRAQLFFPQGVAVDSAGNLYIADRNNHRIRRVDSTGTITTLAGTGESGFSGDGGPATQAQISWPIGVAVAGTGNLYIGDSRNHRIRRVDATTGTIATIAGTGQAGFSGDGDPATQAQLYYPFGLTVDGAGNLYIGDSNNHRIRKVDAATGTIDTIAGTGVRGCCRDGGPAVEGRLFNPFGVALDGAGNLYIADAINDRIRKVDATTGTITTIAGTWQDGFGGDGGPATEALLYVPRGVAVDSAGNIYIADSLNDRIRKVDAATGTIATVAGRTFGGDGDPATLAHIHEPNGVATDGAGNLYIADSNNHRIRKVDATAGTITTIAGTGESGFNQDGGPATQAQLYYPEGLAVDGAGDIYIADTNNRRIRKVDAATGTITTVAGTGVQGHGGDGGPATLARLWGPTGVAVDGTGNIYIADTNSHRIRKVDAATGIIDTIAGDGAPGYSGDGGPAIFARLDYAYGVAVDGAGNIYIADTDNHGIRKVDATTGTITTVAGILGVRGFGGDGGLAREAYLSSPAGVAVDSAGNLYITDRDNRRIRFFDTTTKTLATIAGTGESGFSGDGGPATQAQLTWPTGVAVDSAGNVYFADSYHNRIRRLTPRSTPPPPPPPPPTTGGGGGGGGGSGPERPPSYPGTIRAEGGDGEVTLTWDAPASRGSSRIQHYEYRIDGEGEWISTGSTGRTHTITGLIAGRVYFFHLRAVSAAGVGSHRISPEATPVADLDFTHFTNGGFVTSALVLVNAGAYPVRPAIYFYDQDGDPIAARSLVALTPDLEILDDGALRPRPVMNPLSELTIATHGRGGQRAGSVTVRAASSIGGVLRFDIPGFGVAGVADSPTVRDALVPVRRQAMGINTGVAIRNRGTSTLTVQCRLMQDGAVLEETDIRLRANGQDARFIDAIFPAADTSDFAGSVRCTAPEPGRFSAVAFELDGVNRIFTTLPVVPVPPQEQGQDAAQLDFTHFANGGDIVSDLVLVNAGADPIRPTIHFFDQDGDPIAVESVVDITEELEIGDDGALRPSTAIAPLSELTISTHGRGGQVSGSVAVMADGPIGGVLRFDIPALGVAGVGDSPPLRDALVPVRRQTDGINTGVAVHNRGEAPLVVRCRLMQAGVVLEETMIPLAANGQDARFIDQVFPTADTSDFVGSVRCMTPEPGLFSAVAFELDGVNRIFTTLPVVPVVDVP